VAEELLEVGATIEDLSKIAALPGAPDAQVASAFFLKGVRLGSDGRLVEAIGAYEEVERRFLGKAEGPILVIVAISLLNKALAHSALEQSSEAVEALEIWNGVFGERPDPVFAGMATAVLLELGGKLQSLGRLAEAAEAYDALIRRFEKSNDPRIELPLAVAFARLGSVLSKLDRPEEAIDAFDSVVRRFAGRSEELFAFITVWALAGKGARLALLNRHEESLAAWDEIDQRYGGRAGSTFVLAAAAALAMKGRALESLRRPEEAVETYSRVSARFGDSADAEIAAWVAKSLLQKALTLNSLGQFDRAIEALDDLLRRVGNRGETELALLAARSRFNKALTLGVLGRHDERLREISALTEGIQRTEGPLGHETVVSDLVLRTSDDASWRRDLPWFVESFETVGQLTDLGIYVLETVPAFLREGQPDMAARWLEVWTELTADKPEMWISLRILRAAVAFLEGKGEEAVQQLPAEERAVLKELLDRPSSRART